MKRKTLALALLCLATLASAKVKLPSLVCDNMVLQQQTDARLWGKATPKSQVSVTPSWSNETVTVQADKNGDWLLTVKTPEAGFTPYEVTFNDGEGAVTVKNVLIGEVWLGGGQSNMEMPLKGFGGCMIQNGVNDIIASADNKGVRYFTVPKRQEYEPQTECGGTWQVPSPETAPDFGATAYYFATSVSKALGIPVGIINSSYGGSRVESWMNRELLEKCPDIKLGKKDIETTRPEYERPLVMYNAMIHPIVNYTIKGIIFYQGCSNVGRHEHYAERLAQMVDLWRGLWKLGEIPFYYVEIAPYDYDSNTQNEKAALLREAQFRAQSLIPNSAMISTNDLVEPYERFNIHPRRKREVGERLSYLALNLTYGMKQIYCFGPQYKSWTAKNNEAWISFDHLEMGICRNYDLKGFEVAGEDRVFHPADKVWVHWQTNEVVVTSERVPRPAAVRYCFRDFQIGTMIGANELPTVPFRTDNW